MDFDNKSDEELNLLRLKQEEKLERYLKCFNEQTERTIEYLIQIEEEIRRRDYIKYSNCEDHVP